jgi:beta-lactamase class A
MTSILRLRAGILLSAVIVFSMPADVFAQRDSLRANVERIIGHARGSVGVAVLGPDNSDTLTVNGNGRFPMQSVYKFPLALAVLDQVDRGLLSLDQHVRIRKADLLPDTWSPLREDHPGGDVALTLSELLIYTVSKSDNNGCDILFRLLGGPKRVEEYIRSLGVTDIAIVSTEEEMHKDRRVQYGNWSSPSAMARLLSLFDQGKILSTRSKEFLWDAMVKTSNGPRRINGFLPAGTVVAHKSGSSGTDDDGFTAATNDAGIITVPGGRHVILVVFVSDAASEEKTCEDIIAGIAREVWDGHTK